MANGLLSQIANPDVTTPLLQGMGLARQRQQDVQARQQQEVLNQARQQQQAFQQQQFQAQQAQISFDNELDLIDKANEAGFTGQRNKRLAPLLGVTPEELNALDEDGQKKITNAIRQATKVFKDPKVGTESTNQQIGSIGQLLKDELNIGQVQQPVEAQPQVAQQPQVTPQTNITQARQGIAQLQSITPRNAQEKAQLDASVNQLEGFITDETRKITTGNVTNVDKMFNTLTAVWKDNNPGMPLTPEITKNLREQAHQTVGGTTRIIGADPKTGNLLALDSKTGEVIDMGRPKPAPGKLQPLSSQATENVGVQNSVIQGIDRAIENVTKNPKLLEKVGPLEGRWTNLKRMFVADPEAEGLKREIESMIRVAYAWSGKQISIQELDRLKDAILPSLDNPDANFMVSLRHAKNIMTTDRNAKLQAFKDANFDIGKLDRFLGEEPTGRQTSSGNRFTVEEQ